MLLKTEDNNYAATIVKIHNLVDLENADRLVGFPIHGLQALVAKDLYTVGQVGVVFCAETELSEEFCRENNLFTKPEMNKDKTKKGYIVPQKRVKAIKLRGERSDALFLPLSCLDYLGIDTNQFKVGDSFTHINGTEVCRKYLPKKARMAREQSSNRVKGRTKVFKRFDNKLVPEHFSTDNYWKNAHKFKDDDDIVITLKLHGTSVRLANQLCRRKLTWRDRIAKFFGALVSDMEYDLVAASRRVIKDLHDKAKEHNHFHHTGQGNLDIYNQQLEKVRGIIPKNWILYGEIVGWSGQSPIQKSYTYGIPEGQSELYIYRISVVNPDGVVADLSWDHIKEWCDMNGVKHVPEMWRGKFIDFHVDKWMNVKYSEQGFVQALPLGPEAPCDEGVCVRREGVQPYIVKAKSPDFLQHETKLYDKGEVDIETEES